jgi:hypothetical protein
MQGIKPTFFPRQKNVDINRQNRLITSYYDTNYEPSSRLKENNYRIKGLVVANAYGVCLMERISLIHH